jgi:hypothetical protein
MPAGHSVKRFKFRVRQVPGNHTISVVERSGGLRAQTGLLVQTDWREFLHGPRHHDQNPKENVLSVSNVGPDGESLDHHQHGYYNLEVVVANGVLYAASCPIGYYPTIDATNALDATTG